MLPNLGPALFSLEEKNNFIGEDSWCVGTCNAWLVLLDKEADPFLVNPFTGSPRITLPAIDTLPRKTVVGKPYFIKILRKSYISKAVVFGHSGANGNFGVVVLYGCLSMLAFWKNGDCVWNSLPGPTNKVYSDVMVHDELVYALTDGAVIEIWDLLGSSPVKKRDIRTSMPRQMMEVNQLYQDRHSSKWYLVESCGDLLLVVRYIGNFVNGKGVAVDESDLLSNEDTHPLVCPYRTLMFYVYKLDFDEKTWMEMESLGKRALYLGGNNSLSLSAEGFLGVEGNTIYFTDDNWEQMNEDYLYGGHDLGKFNLEEKVVMPILEMDSGRIDPPPFWIFPTPW